VSSLNHKWSPKKLGFVSLLLLALGILICIGYDNIAQNHFYSSGQASKDGYGAIGKDVGIFFISVILALPFIITAIIFGAVAIIRQFSRSS